MKRVVRLTDRPGMTLDVYRGRKTTIQQQYNNSVSDTFGIIGLYMLVGVNQPETQESCFKL